MIAILMGVAGAGKTTVGRALAARLGWAFYDADDLHADGAVERMRRGIPLTEVDRAAWLDRLSALVEDLRRRGTPTVLACSALRRSHRERLGAGAPDVRFVYLKADREVLRRRLETRQGHYFGAELLESQLATLEEPPDALVVDADAPPAVLAERVAAALAPAGGDGGPRP